METKSHPQIIFDMQQMLTGIKEARQQRPIIVSVDGGIGSGKSTTVEQLKTVFAGMPNVCFIPEPVDTVWNTVVDERGETILANFYRDPKGNAFKFQMMAYIFRACLFC